MGKRVKAIQAAKLFGDTVVVRYWGSVPSTRLRLVLASVRR